MKSGSQEVQEEEEPAGTRYFLMFYFFNFADSSIQFVQSCMSAVVI